MTDSPRASLSELLAECLDDIDRGIEPDIDGRCGSDPERAAVLRSRLRVARAIDGVIAGPFERTEPAGTPRADTQSQGEIIGSWRLGTLIGEGGFGSVYEATRTDGHDDRVAIKLLHHGARSSEARARFKTEAEALALVRHPNVASILDSGVTDAGVPYLVLELIEGESIDRYCDRHSLPVAARVQLMLAVCRTVEHAHARGVMHRDLKPSNVLVTRVGDAHVPKLIDFGIARFIQGIGPDRTRITTDGQVIGTARYMSPEQLGIFDKAADGASMPPDTLSDVYSLGVMLYELIARVLPYDDESRPMSSVFDLQQRMRSSEPRRLSARVSHDSVRSVRELDWITLKCLEIDPGERYGTCRELADDLDRFIAGEAVYAGPRSRMYLTRKFVSRHRAAVGTAAAATLGLVVAAAGTSWGLVQARAETTRALAAEADSQRITDFQYSMLRNLDPAVIGTAIGSSMIDRAGNETIGGSDTLEATTRDVISELSMTDIGVRVLDAGVFEPAIARIDDAFTDSAHLKSRLLNAIATAQVETGLVSEGVGTHTAAYETVLAELGPDAEATVLAKRDLANALQIANRPEEALALLDGVRASLEGRVSDSDLDVIVSILDKGSALYNTQRWDEARSEWSLALERATQSLGNEHELTVTARGNLALVLTDLGEYEQAEPLLRAVRDQVREQAGDDNAQSVIVTDNLGRCLALAGKADEAVVLYKEGVPIAERVLGASHQFTHRMRGNLVAALVKAEHYDEALAAGARHIEALRNDLGSEDPLLVSALHSKGKALVALDRFEEAAVTLAEMLTLAEAVFGTESQLFAMLQISYADALAGLGRHDETLNLCEAAYASLKAHIGAEHSETQKAVRLALRVIERNDTPQHSVADDREGRVPLATNHRVRWLGRLSRSAAEDAGISPRR
ncbi:MAG: serine/threonine-protein kinase [Planctomycetota bacterium]